MNRSSSVENCLIVRGPGGLPGLDVHAGAWLALSRAGIQGRCLCGCSAGALVSAMDCCGRLDADGFAEVIRGLRDRDVIRKRSFWKSRALWIEAFCDPTPVRALVETYLPNETGVDDARLVMSATAMTRVGVEPPTYFCGAEDLHDQVMASMAIAGIFPYQMVFGVPYSDGGTSDALPIPDEHTLYDHIIVLNPGRAQSFRERDKNMISRLLWNVERLGRKEQEWERARLRHDPRVTWIDLDMGTASMLEFDHELIEQAEAYTRSALITGGLVEC